MRISLAFLSLAVVSAAQAAEPVTLGATVEARVVAVSPLRSTVATSTEECRLSPVADVDRLNAAALAGQRNCTTTTATSREPDGWLVSLRTTDGRRLTGRMQAAPAIGGRVRVPLTFISLPR